MTLDQLSGLDVSDLRRLAEITPHPDAIAPTSEGNVASIRDLRACTTGQATRNELGKGLVISAQRETAEHQAE